MIWRGYVRFFGPSPSKSGKTCTWLVHASQGGFLLGEVRWFSRWRRYAFHPAPNTVFEQECLRDIANFCETATKKHKEKRPQ